MRDHLVRVLEDTGWNVARTAAILEISRNTVSARIERFGLRPSPSTASRRRGAPRGLPADRPSSGPSATPAPAFPAAAAAASTMPRVRWERRSLTLLRLRLEGPADTELSAQHLLDLMAEKVQGFGGRLEGLSPTGLLASFGIELADEPATLAAHS